MWFLFVMAVIVAIFTWKGGWQKAAVHARKRGAICVMADLLFTAVLMGALAMLVNRFSR
jgi:hypothetical protein